MSATAELLRPAPATREIARAQQTGCCIVGGGPGGAMPPRLMAFGLWRVRVEDRMLREKLLLAGGSACHAQMPVEVL